MTLGIGNGHGLFDFIYAGISQLFPPIIFVAGALTDFGPLIANPRTLLLGAAANVAVLITFLAASLLPVVRVRRLVSSAEQMVRLVFTAKNWRHI